MEKLESLDSKNVQKYFKADLKYELSNFGSVKYEINILAEYVPGGSISNLVKNGFC